MISGRREYYIRAPMYWLFLSIAWLSNYLRACLSNVTSIISLSNITYVCHIASMFSDSVLSERWLSSICPRTFHHDCFRTMLVGWKVICSSILVVQRAQLLELLWVLHNTIFVLSLPTTHMFELFIYQICVLPVSVFSNSLTQDQIIEIAFDADWKHWDIIICSKGFVYKPSIYEFLIGTECFAAHNAQFKIIWAYLKNCLFFNQLLNRLLSSFCDL